MKNKPPTSPAVKFRIDIDQYEEMKEYARVKGHRTVANLARVATIYYMNKNKLRK